MNDAKKMRFTGIIAEGLRREMTTEDMKDFAISNPTNDDCSWSDVQYEASNGRVYKAVWSEAHGRWEWLFEGT